jgi:hypothetical protein
MDEIISNPPAPHIEAAETLKAYRQPKLTPLGSIHSLVQTHPGGGADGGSLGNSFGS